MPKSLKEIFQAATKKTMKENAVTTPFQINDGYCEEWALNVEDAIPGAIEHDTPEDFTGPGHVWVEIDGKHYDAETLQGVKDWKDLAVFRKSKEVNQMLKDGKGYRCESYMGSAERRAAIIVRYEVEEMGNEHIIEDACKALGLDDCNLDNVLKAIEKEFGPDAMAIWLATKEYASKYYCGPGERPTAILIPKDAVIISDLKDEGALFAWKRTEKTDLKS